MLYYDGKMRDTDMTDHTHFSSEWYALITPHRVSTI